jgi:hypothetical protein
MMCFTILDFQDVDVCQVFDTEVKALEFIETSLKDKWSEVDASLKKPLHRDPAEWFQEFIWRDETIYVLYGIKIK